MSKNNEKSGRSVGEILSQNLALLSLECFGQTDDESPFKQPVDADNADHESMKSLRDRLSKNLAAFKATKEIVVNWCDGAILMPERERSNADFFTPREIRHVAHGNSPTALDVANLYSENVECTIPRKGDVLLLTRRLDDDWKLKIIPRWKNSKEPVAIKWVHIRSLSAEREEDDSGYYFDLANLKQNDRDHYLSGAETRILLGSGARILAK